MQMKSWIRKFLVRLGFWYPLDLLRKIPEILHYLRSGCSGVAPHPIKMRVVEYYLKTRSISEFFETGTYLGDTLGYIAKSGVHCTSIELSEELYQLACKRFSGYRNVKLVLGDSGKKLPESLNKIDKPVLFWLDGHYSSGITASAEAHSPINTELEAILNHSVKKHVILIDDARCFDGSNGYPNLDDLLHYVRQDGNYSAQISTDIIRLTPLD